MSDLLKIISLIYRMTDVEVEDLTARLLEQRKRAWRTAIAAEAAQCGYTGPAEGPRRHDLDYLRELCELDAASIARTLARDVERELQRLYDAHYRGNRYYYIKHMEAWAEQRNAWKAPQIARQTEMTVKGYAQQRFWQENGLRGERFYFAGPPPACGVCIGHFAAGLVDQQYVDRHPTPIHINCPHTWARAGTVPCPSSEELWVG